MQPPPKTPAPKTPGSGSRWSGQPHTPSTWSRQLQLGTDVPVLHSNAHGLDVLRHACDDIRAAGQRAPPHVWPAGRPAPPAARAKCTLRMRCAVTPDHLRLLLFLCADATHGAMEILDHRTVSLVRARHSGREFHKVDSSARRFHLVLPGYCSCYAYRHRRVCAPRAHRPALARTAPRSAPTRRAARAQGSLQTRGAARVQARARRAHRAGTRNSRPRPPPPRRRLAAAARDAARARTRRPSAKRRRRWSRTMSGRAS